jgi:hypothetical protein
MRNLVFDAAVQVQMNSTGISLTAEVNIYDLINMNMLSQKFRHVRSAHSQQRQIEYTKINSHTESFHIRIFFFSSSATSYSFRWRYSPL